MDAIALHRLVSDSSPVGIVLVDAREPQMPAVYVNEAYCALTGYAAQEILGKNLRFLQGQDRDQDARQRLRESLALAQSHRALLRNYRKDGSLFWNEMSIVPIVEGEGPPTHFAGFHRDAGERLRMDPRARDTLSGAHQPTAFAIRDDRLTGLYTQGYLEELLKRDWAIAQREKRSIAVFNVDIDALDLYNTTFGRAAGDSAIRRVAHCIAGCLRRASDVTARLDGGNLLAFAPGIDREHALGVANTMVERVRELRIHHPRCAVLRYVTVSAGVAAWVPANADRCEHIIERSRTQLRMAKSAGRNRAL